jgi:predicted metal-dependent phosphoesterase TrpH
VVARAAAAGVRLLALTDHDTVAGVGEAALAAERIGVRLVAGVEISAVDPSHGDLHLLGYVIDDHQALLRERLRRYREDRKRGAGLMARALTELGFELDRAELRAHAAAGRSIGRPHLAQAVVAAPANAERLRAEGCLEASFFLREYLAQGRPGFRPRTVPSVPEAISAIHDAGGVAVWAHPFWDVSDPLQVLATIDRFRSLGLDGVECFYPSHDRRQAELLAERCDELGLLSTGSSDFHGPAHRHFSSFRAFSTHGRRPALGPIGE